MMSSTHDVVGVGQRGNVAVQGRLGLAEDGERRRGIPGGVPVEGAALGIGVNEQHSVLVFGERGRQVQGKRRLAYAALLIEKSRDHDCNWRFYPRLMPEMPCGRRSGCRQYFSTHQPLKWILRLLKSVSGEFRMRLAVRFRL